MEVDPHTMNTPQILQYLCSLRDLPPKLSDWLDRLIQSDEENHYLLNLQGSELTWLVDFLDRVRPLPSASFQLTKRTLQVLGVTSITDDVSRRCLRKLQAICSHNKILPPSHIISGGLHKIGNDTIGREDLANVWNGTFNGAKVHIKAPRISNNVSDCVSTPHQIY